LIYLFYVVRRMLVSARHKGEPLGLLEYNRNGECIGRLTSHIQMLRTVVHIAAGHLNVLLCSSSGLMGRMRLRRSTSQWSSVTPVELHKSAVLYSAAIHRSGIDFFFTSDKYCNIGVVVIEHDRILKAALNATFVHSPVSAMELCANFLYLGQSDGVVLVLDVGDLLDGDLKKAATLKDSVIFYGDIFDNKTPIASMGVVSPHAYFDLPTQDSSSHKASGPSISERVRSDGFSSASMLSAALYGGPEGGTFNVPDAVLQGHLVMFGGGDGDPRVKVMRVIRVTPRAIDSIELGRADGKADSHTLLQEVAILRGHTKAVTSIVVDAAGRFIITASKEDRMFLVWNALTYTCEKLVDDLEFGIMRGGPNCLFLCSFKPPYLTMFTVTQQRSEGWEANQAVTADGRPEIGMVRTNLWCVACVKGGLPIPSKSVVRAQQYLGDRGRAIVEMWQKHHNHVVKDVYRGGEAVRSGATSFIEDEKSVVSRSQSESQRLIDMKPKTSKKNFIPTAGTHNDRKSRGVSKAWGGETTDLGVLGLTEKDIDSASDASSDQWGRNAEVEDDEGEVVIEEPSRGDSVIEEEIMARVEQEHAVLVEPDSDGDDDGAEARSRQRRIMNKKLPSQGRKGLMDESSEEDEETELQNASPFLNTSAPTTSSSRNPFHGKIPHKGKLLNSPLSSTGLPPSVGPNRKMRVDDEGNELSRPSGLKAHFSDDSDDEDTRVVIFARQSKKK
jgi:hypothetical protein